jgi:hypothetical protein
MLDELSGFTEGGVDEELIILELDRAPTEGRGWKP